MNTVFLIIATIIVTIGLSVILVCVGTSNWTEDEDDWKDGKGR